MAAVAVPGWCREVRMGELPAVKPATCAAPTGRLRAEKNLANAMLTR